MSQPELFPGEGLKPWQKGPPPPAQRHSPTSEAAGKRARSSAESWRAKVLAIIRLEGERGATDEEIQDALDMNPSTERPRRVELVKLGLVVDSGETRKTRSNRKAVVWTAKGLDE